MVARVSIKLYGSGCKERHEVPKVTNANRIWGMKSHESLNEAWHLVYQVFLPCPAASTPRAILLVPSSRPFPREAKASPSGFPVLPVTPVTVLPTCKDCQHKFWTSIFVQLTSSSSSSGDTSYGAQETSDAIPDGRGDSSHAASNSRFLVFSDGHCDS